MTQHIRGHRGMLEIDCVVDGAVVKLLYVRLVLRSWSTSLPSPRSPVEVLTDEVFHRLKAFVNEQNGLPFLLLDWRGISALERPALELWWEIRKLHVAVLHVGLSTEIHTKIEATDEVSHSSAVSHLEGISGILDRTVLYLPSPASAGVNGIVSKHCGSSDSLLAFIDEHVTSYLKQETAACFNNNPQYLRSTPLKANGFFDGQKIIGNPASFSWFALRSAATVKRLLSLDRVPEKKREGEFRSSQHQETRLLACTQNGVSFAMAISNMIHVDDVVADGEDPEQIGVDVIDRFGPSQMFIEEYSCSEQSTPDSYIFVGDFVIAGTELKIAEVHAYHRRAQLRHAVVVGSVLEESSSSQTAGVVSKPSQQAEVVSGKTTSKDARGRSLLRRVMIHSLVNVHNLKTADDKPLELKYVFP